MKIDPNEVDRVFRDCLFQEKEIQNGVPQGAVLVAGIVNNFGFHPERLQAHVEEIRTWLLALPHDFRGSVGGGWSFLNACVDDEGVQWGQHSQMEQLFVLGEGCGLVSCLLPREFWASLPGGMPYYRIND